MRLAPPRLGRRNPLQRQPELLLEYKLMAQPCLVVRGQGDDQRSLGPQVHIDARDGQQFGGESGPARLAFAAERNQGFFAGLGLGPSRQHAGGRMARAGTGCAPVEYSNRRPPRRQSPGNGKADNAGADDGDLELSDIGCGAVRQPAAPFAGMTQTEYPSLLPIKGLEMQTAAKRT